MSGRGSNINSVFYAEAYHPIQAGSIDGADTLLHDNAVYRAVLCSSLSTPNSSAIHTASSLSPASLRAVSEYGHVKKLRLVRDIVTGVSCGYASVK